MAAELNKNAQENATVTIWAFSGIFIQKRAIIAIYTTRENSIGKIRKPFGFLKEKGGGVSVGRRQQ